MALAGCNEDSGGISDPCANGFDQSALFANLADNLILPGYGALETRARTLNDLAEDFTSDPDLDGLQSLQEAWKEANTDFQAVAPDDFGPAEDVFLANSLNNFPLNEDALEANIQSGSWDLDRPDAYDQCFPALDYLLFGLAATDAETVEVYTGSRQRLPRARHHPGGPAKRLPHGAGLALGPGQPASGHRTISAGPGDRRFFRVFFTPDQEAFQSSAGFRQRPDQANFIVSCIPLPGSLYFSSLV